MFSTVTIYRLDHTYSLGSVEPTIALSKSLWSRIVTLIKKIEKKKKLKRKKNSFVSSFVSHWLWSYRVLESACLFIWAISKKKKSKKIKKSKMTKIFASVLCVIVCFVLCSFQFRWWIKFKLLWLGECLLYVKALCSLLWI